MRIGITGSHFLCQKYSDIINKKTQNFSIPRFF